MLLSKNLSKNIPKQKKHKEEEEEEKNKQEPKPEWRPLIPLTKKGKEATTPHLKERKKEDN